MNVSHFFDHWGIAENPFRGEEARHDTVFARMSFTPESSGAGSAGSASVSGEQQDRVAALGSVHSDFEKVLGELTRPSTSVVFGEKGSGKTAIRMQIEDRIKAHNAKHPDSRIFAVSYDDPGPFISEITDRRASAKDPLAPFRAFGLVEHMDAVLALATERIVGALFKEGPDRPVADLGPEPVKSVRKLPLSLRTELITLGALYDRSDVDGARAARLRRVLKLAAPKGDLLWKGLTWFGWAPAAATGFLASASPGETTAQLLVIIAIVLLVAYLGVLVKRFAWDRLAMRSLARRVRESMTAMPRSRDAIAASFRSLDPGQRRGALVPWHDTAEEARYASFDALRRLMGRFGYTGVLVLIDRVDEPALVNGDPDKMRELIWPLFNSKFLQQDRFGVKMLLPIELRHALFKESSAFFQEARLDKQSLVERLTWTGPMLYDLCNARLRSCLAKGTEPLNLIDLFAEDVTRNDVVDALDQMHQPRDAFKFVYRCLNEHCANVTADQNEWRIPKLVLDSVRRAEADRVQQLHRGIRPA